MLLSSLAFRATLVRRAAVSPRKIHVAKAPQRFLARGIGRESARNQLLHLRIEVKPEFLVEIGVDVASPEAEISAPRW
jgi:hypothetical protein